MRRTFVLMAGFTLAATALVGQPATPTASFRRPESATKSSSVRTIEKTYGTTATSYLHLGAAQFTVSETTTTYSDVSFGSFAFGRYPTAGTGYFIATPQLPSGAIVETVEFDACDNSTSGGFSETFRVDGANRMGQSVDELAIGTTTPNAGCVTTTLALSTPFVAQNNQNQLILLVNIPVFDGSKTFSGAVVPYKLQVSPAPNTATFPDVPTDDFGFQYVEALVASGITGGCGGGNYCPDAPVTRRQMAIFLAKALGLQWP